RSLVALARRTGQVPPGPPGAHVPAARRGRRASLPRAARRFFAPRPLGARPGKGVPRRLLLSNRRRLRAAAASLGAPGRHPPARPAEVEGERPRLRAPVPPLLSRRRGAPRAAPLARQRARALSRRSESRADGRRG